MMAAEVGQRRAVDHRPFGRAELPLEDRMRVGAGDSVHGVEAMRKPEAKSARMASKSNRLCISERYWATGSTISTTAPSTLISPSRSMSTSGASEIL